MALSHFDVDHVLFVTLRHKFCLSHDIVRFMVITLQSRVFVCDIMALEYVYHIPTVGYVRHIAMSGNVRCIAMLRYV
jgi:hypothetical protein